MKTYKILKISLLVIAVSFSVSYFTSKFISGKIQHESLQAQYLTVNVKFLRDLYTLCMLDYAINPNGKDIIQDCKKVAQQIELGNEYLQESMPYYNFYKKIFN